MKKIFPLFAVLLFSISFLNAQTETPVQTTEVEEQKAYPVMEFESVVVDYGVIEQDSDPYRYFEFTNTGDAPLIITNAKGSCGCTVPTWPKEAIAPGETGQIKVRYATNRLNKFSKSITLTTNEENPTRKLTIKGEVKPKPTEEAIPSSGSGF
jgi:hypothetical protein